MWCWRSEYQGWIIGWFEAFLFFPLCLNSALASSETVWNRTRGPSIESKSKRLFKNLKEAWNFQLTFWNKNPFESISFKYSFGLKFSNELFLPFFDSNCPFRKIKNFTDDHLACQFQFLCQLKAGKIRKKIYNFIWCVTLI